MKVKIEYTVDVDDDFRREINIWYGEPGLADREKVKRWFKANGHSMNDDLGAAYLERQERQEASEEES